MEYVVCRESELPEGTHRTFEVGGRQIGVFNVAGAYYALPNLCPHQLGPLCQGRVSGTLVSRAEQGWRLQWEHEGEIVTCPWHGLEFHIPSGRCMAYADIKLKSYPVRCENGKVLVSV